MKEAKEFAESIAAIFIETSARNAVNVEELFQKISRFHFFNSMLCVNIYYFESWQGEGSVMTEKAHRSEWMDDFYDLFYCYKNEIRKITELIKD